MSRKEGGREENLGRERSTEARRKIVREKEKVREGLIKNQRWREKMSESENETLL